MKTVSAGTSARRQRASLVAGAPRSLACPSLLLLLELVLESTAGTHSLHYHYLTLSEPGPGLPWFLAVGYVDDQPFMRYDSRVGRAEPQAPWMASMDTQYWETETQKYRAWAEVQQVNLWIVMSYYNQSGGIHSAQRMFGCDIQEDSLSSSFWHFGFDGQDHVSLDLETLSWVSAEPVAVQTKRVLDSERCYAEYDKAYLESLCLTSLRRYLELGSQILTRREPPTVQVTRHPIQDRGATLRCWALGFYPKGISLSWWLGEKELALETEYVETRPSGDGTYQTWAAVQVPAGEEAAYTCHVQHSGLNHVLTVAWEPPSSQGLIAMVTCPLLFLLVVGVVILTRRYLQGRNKEPYEQAPGDCAVAGWGEEAPGVPKCCWVPQNPRRQSTEAGDFPGFGSLHSPAGLEPGGEEPL
ncbi:class I histocompatibility antigen, Gogo-C*0202 alpha chain-like [Artibeus jamaicensis]|uniref:class I histocompatibility antigen, Gogo-C*0202 alpha chain-like n=1 Tax=Artibeus jamaicensis TaxID=9417 RepID=UPI00235A9BB0|nr:class I histocompatibility antigen, Gogo-C*0202 alpha chain-like [Artibeus jamaicensis]